MFTDGYYLINTALSGIKFHYPLGTQLRIINVIATV